METWRLLDTGCADGATNMAIDEALLLSHEQGKTPPTLRFYGWQPSCLSIGIFQSIAREVDIAECLARGIDLVRRPTGGRAVLHASELTYAVVTRRDHPLVSGSIQESYCRISQALASGLRLLGADVRMTPKVPRAQRTGHSSACIKTPACFDTPSSYEVTSNGRKLVGSAQVRKQGIVLQHGSIMIDVDAPQLAAVLRMNSDGSQESLVQALSTRMVGLREALGREVSYPEVVHCLIRGFQEDASLILVPGELTREEYELARQLREQKYLKREWTYRR